MYLIFALLRSVQNKMVSIFELRQGIKQNSSLLEKLEPCFPELNCLLAEFFQKMCESRGTALKKKFLAVISIFILKL